MRFIPRNFIRRLNIFVILSLLGQSLLPLIAVADVSEVESATPEPASIPVANIVRDFPLPPPSSNIQANLPATPIDGMSTYLGLSDAVRVEVTSGTASPVNGYQNVDLMGDGNYEWTIDDNRSVMDLEVEFAFAIPAGSQWVIEARQTLGHLEFKAFYWDGQFWQRMDDLNNYGDLAGIVPASSAKFRFTQANTPIQPANIFEWDAFRIGGPGTMLPADQTYAPNECPLGSNAETRHYVGGPVDTYSGNYNYQTTDLSIPTLSNPLKFERSYNSQTITGTTTGVYTRPLGYGWTHNYDVSLIFPSDPGGEENTLILKACRGSRLRFEDKGDGTYTPYPGVRASLSQIGETYLITAANQSVYTFGTSAGNPARSRLLTMRDPKGNETTFTYTADRLTRVTGPSNSRWLDFAYDGQGRLTTLTDHTGRAAGYGYDTQDRLTVMTDARGLVWTYNYSGTTSLLHAVIDPEGRAVERTWYNEESQAISQENGAGDD